MGTDPVEILNRRNAEVAKIRGYADLTEEAKERRIAEVNERAKAEYAEAREAAEREIRERREKAEPRRRSSRPTTRTPPRTWSKHRYAPSGGAPTIVSTTASSSSSRRRPARSWIGSWRGRSARRTPSWPTPSTTLQPNGAREAWPTLTSRRGHHKSVVGRSTLRPARRLPKPGT
jgi:hypothetical protein